MANQGVRDTTFLAMLTGWDATELQNFQLQDGTSYAAVAGQLNAALVSLNAEFSNDWMAQLYSVTDQPDLEYRVGSSNGFVVHTEYGRADAARAATEGHMLPLIPYERMLGWTWDLLRKARMPQIKADIADAIKDARDKRRIAILTRLLKNGDDSGTANGLGSSGYSPGFATTAGSTSVDFLPPSYGGTSFATTHEHYNAHADGAWTNAIVSDLKSELREHGHEPPYMLLISPSDETVVRALSDFVPVAQSLVRYGSTQDLATLGIGEIGLGAYPIGAMDDFGVYVVRGMPQYYGFATKSYGRLSQRNPVAIRLQKGISQWSVVAMPDPNAGNGMYPLQHAMLFMEFGVGVKDRTNGSPCYVYSGTWADGTAT